MLTKKYGKIRKIIIKALVKKERLKENDMKKICLMTALVALSTVRF